MAYMSWLDLNLHWKHWLLRRMLKVLLLLLLRHSTH